MARRGGRGRRGFNQRSRKNDGNDKLISMLDMGRVVHFRYDARQVLRRTSMEQKVWQPFLSTLIAKASRSSIKEGREYIQQKEEEGIITNDTAESLSRLLNRYRKWR